ncbi:MAG: alanine:cation symporter family protein [Bacteroidaceae bacterium]|nr:alanine:cation symporter family protein [Bacteroidaceae bacterium]
MDEIFVVIENVQQTLWTYVVLALLVGCSLYFTVRLGFVQFRHLGEMLRQLMKSGTHAKSAHSIERKAINSFQAFTISLASRVGTGNLAGVASAIAVGGPGAVFWMWMMALLASATAFMEATLAQLFKRRGEDSFYGGPAYYMLHGLHSRWMGILFGLGIIVTFGMANQMIQSRTICDAVCVALGWNEVGMALALMLMTMAVIFGGVHRISRFSAVVVPVMAVGYLILSIYILIANIQQVPVMLTLIMKSAFGLQQAGGAVVGVAVMQGVKRGLFSNEAGEGSAPHAAATATISHPVKQGLLQSLGVFVDTLVICTCTAFVILLSGLYDNGEDGSILTGSAMQLHLGVFGRWYLTAIVFLFAFSTIIGNYFYGESNIRFITKKRWPIQAFRIVSALTVFFGGLVTLIQAWSVIDFMMAIIVIINLVAVMRLAKYVYRLKDDYFRQRREGRDPTFRREQLPELDLEAWE